MENQTINLTLTLDEANSVLHALGELPFKEVHQLINKIHLSAEEQISKEAQPKNDSSKKG